MSTRALLTSLICAGLLLPFASKVSAKGPKINVEDDPVLGEAGAGLVVIEVADFQ